MTTVNESRVEDQLKEQLNLKYSAASKLVQHAREKSPEEANDDEAVLKAATAIFHNDYSKKEQEEMLVVATNGDGGGGGTDEETDWQRRARLAAEQREREWEAAAAGLPAPSADGPKLPPNVVSQTITKRVGDEEPTVEEHLTQEIPLKEPNEKNTRKTICYCTILWWTLLWWEQNKDVCWLTVDCFYRKAGTDH